MEGPMVPSEERRREGVGLGKGAVPQYEGLRPHKIFQKSVLKVHIFLRWDACRSFVILQLQRLACDTVERQSSVNSGATKFLFIHDGGGGTCTHVPPSGYTPVGSSSPLQRFESVMVKPS